MKPTLTRYRNTVSNVPFFLLACVGFYQSWKHHSPRRFLAVYAGVMAIGLGSAAFHATLEYGPQLMDELPMVWTVLVWAYILFEPHVSRTPGVSDTLAKLLILIGAGASIYHALGGYVVGFQVLFGMASTSCLIQFTRMYLREKDENIVRLGHIAVSALVIGSSCWLADRHLCDEIQTMAVNPQGHAWWHFFMAINAYLGPVLAQYMHYKRLNQDPKLLYLYNIIPYTVPTKEPQVDMSNFWDPTAQFLRRAEFGKFNSKTQ